MSKDGRRLELFQLLSKEMSSPETVCRKISFRNTCKTTEAIHVSSYSCRMMAESNVDTQESKEFHLNWTPDAPAGLTFSHVLPASFGTGYQSVPTADEQIELTTKMRSKRLTSRRHSKVLRTCMGLTYLGEKKFREAANTGNYETVERLIGEGIGVSCADSKKRTALHFAAAKGDDVMVRTLLNHGANPNLKDVNGNTPLHLAACSSHIKIVTMLVESGKSSCNR